MRWRNKRLVRAWPSQSCHETNFKISQRKLTLPAIVSHTVGSSTRVKSACNMYKIGSFSPIFLIHRLMNDNFCEKKILQILAKKSKHI